MVRESTRTVLEELGTVSAIIGAERVDMPKIPPRVIREVMSNAVAHRSYEHAGSAIRVDLHPTRLVAPEFADDGAFFSVTLRLTGAVTSRERAWVRGLVREGRLEGRAGILVVEAARRGSLSNSVAREKLSSDSVEARALAAQGPVTNASLRAGTGLDRQEALKVLRRLADRGALVARGRGRGAHYERPA